LVSSSVLGQFQDARPSVWHDNPSSELVITTDICQASTITSQPQRKRPLRPSVIWECNFPVGPSTLSLSVLTFFSVRHRKIPQIYLKQSIPGRSTHRAPPQPAVCFSQLFLRSSPKFKPSAALRPSATCDYLYAISSFTVGVP
jgi:hypothetical protein